jgi:hypothetical protein
MSEYRYVIYYLRWVSEESEVECHKIVATNIYANFSTKYPSLTLGNKKINLEKVNNKETFYMTNDGRYILYRSIIRIIDIKTGTSGLFTNKYEDSNFFTSIFSPNSQIIEQKYNCSVVLPYEHSFNN